MADQVEHNGKQIPYYWNDHEVHKVAEKASNALFDLQNSIQKTYSTEEYKDDERWREVYNLRCKVGSIEHNVQHFLGYKDGWFHPSNLEGVVTSQNLGVIT